MKSPDRVYHAKMETHVSLAGVEVGWSMEDGQVTAFRQKGYVKKDGNYVVGVGIQFGPSSTEGSKGKGHFFSAAHLTIEQAEVLQQVLGDAITTAKAEPIKTWIEVEEEE